MPLFLPRIIEKHAKNIEFDPAHKATLDKWSENLLAGVYDRETQNDSEFIQKILVDVLGYRGAGTGSAWSVAKNQPVGNGNVDVALGHFSINSSVISAPFELKGAKTKDLDAVISGRNKSPVAQAWEYAIDAKGCEWVIVSNYKEIRLYAFGYGRKEFEVIDLTKIHDSYQYARMMLLLSAENLLGGKTASLLKESEDADKEITHQLYSEFKSLRARLIDSLLKNNNHVTPLNAIRHTQTILDRILFIAFAEDTGLLPDHTLKNAYEVKNPFNPQPVWNNFKGLFQAIDNGNAELKIPGYNGGLFANNDTINQLIIPDELCEGFKKIGEYRFHTEVSVNILGHIFEQSISDLEELKAAASGEEDTIDEKKTKRKKDGIFYTPSFVTRYMVEETVGKWLKQRKDKIGFDQLPILNDDDYSSIKIITKGKGDEKIRSLTYNKKIEKHIFAWETYKEVLSNIKVLDPACGSGAFLNEVFDYLKAEGEVVNGTLTRLKGDQTTLFRWDTHILSNNIFGVDLNSESVEITKLSLWLKTANRNEKLTYLENNIKVGNSLIDDPNVAGKDAFNWSAEFADIVTSGGFDIIIGNPPYTYRNAISDGDKKYFKKTYQSTEGNFDLYKFFIEKSTHLVSDLGYVSLIVPNTFLSAQTYKRLRQIVLDNFYIVELFDLGLNVFDDVVVENIIFQFKRTTEKGETTIKVQRDRSLPLLNYQQNYQIDLTDKAASDENEFNINVSPTFNPIIDTIERHGTPLSRIAYCTVGINTGYIKKELTAKKRLDHRYHPVLNGKDIDRHTFDWPGEWIMYDPDFVKSRGELGRTLPPEEIFTNPKILLQRTRRGMKRKLVGYLDREQYYNLNRVSNVIIKDESYSLEYIYAVINSTLMDFYFNIKFNEYEVKPSHLNRLPIHQVSDSDQSSIINLVRNVLTASADLKANRKKLLDLLISDFGDFKISRKLHYWEDCDWKDFEKELAAKKIVLRGEQKDDWYDRFNRMSEGAKKSREAISDMDLSLDELIYKVYGIDAASSKVIDSYYA